MSHTEPAEAMGRYATVVQQRTVTGVCRAEDGWNVEVEDGQGVRLTYWIACAGCIPRIGDTARFYGGAAGHPIHGLEINDCRVFLDAPVH